VQAETASRHHQPPPPASKVQVVDRDPTGRGGVGWSGWQVGAVGEVARGGRGGRAGRRWAAPREWATRVGRVALKVREGYAGEVAEEARASGVRCVGREADVTNEPTAFRAIGAGGACDLGWSAIQSSWGGWGTPAESGADTCAWPCGVRVGRLSWWTAAALGHAEADVHWCPRVAAAPRYVASCPVIGP